jgi:hypothetical protein
MIAHRFSLPDQKQIQRIIEGLRTTVEEGRRMYRETLTGDAGPGMYLKTYDALAAQASELIVDRLKEVWQERIHRKSAS